MRAMVLAAPGAPLQVQERDDPTPATEKFASTALGGGRR
jgi:hypothetical protein